MIRVVAIAAGLLSLASCKAKTVCGPYKDMNLPGITKIDRCDEEPTSDYGIGGETTASGDDFVKAIAASGYELGRDSESTFGEAKDMQYLRKGGATYYMFTKLMKRPSGANFFSIVPARGEPKTWLPEATWQKVLTARADRQALLDKLRRIGDLLAKAPKAPAVCDGALGSLDPALAKTGKDLLVNLSSRELKGDAGRGSTTFVTTTYDGSTEYSEKVSRLLDARAETDRIAARRVVPVISITDYKEVKESEGGAASVLRFVSGGEAKLDIAVVDLEANRVLCRSKAEASIVDKSKPPPKDAPTFKGKDGKDVAVWMEDVSSTNLDAKIAEAAMRELTRMNPAFGR